MCVSMRALVYDVCVKGINTYIAVLLIFRPQHKELTNGNSVFVN